MQTIADPAHLTHMPSSAALPATISPRTRARADTQDSTGPSSATARQRRGACHPKHRTPSSHATHIAHSRATYKHKPRTPARCPARHQPLRTIITACTPLRAHHTQHGTQLRPPHKPPTENHTQSHTRPPRHTHNSRVRLPSVDGMLPESWLLLKLNVLQDTRTAIASHHGTRRRRRP
jgi:hypothetical protein